MNIHAIHILIIITATFIFSVILTWAEIPVLRRKAGQNIREEGLKSHYSKAGTPSMGGISIIISTCLMGLIGAVAFGGTLGDELLILLVFAGYGMIGFIDDYRKVIKKENEGLTAKQKFALQMIIAIAFAIFFARYSAFGTSVFIPIADVFIDFGVWYYVFVAFAVLAMTNAVNLTDGKDGSLHIIPGEGTVPLKEIVETCPAGTDRIAEGWFHTLEINAVPCLSEPETSIQKTYHWLQAIDAR